MEIKKQITKPYQHTFNLSKSGLVAIFILARCKSKKQIKSNIDENLRIEINGTSFREIQPHKKIQIFDIPSAFNGSQLKGLKKTVVVLLVLDRGRHHIKLIPKHSAFLEEIKIKNLSSIQDVELDLEEQSEEGNNIPWYTFVLVNLPLNQITIDATITKRMKDSDDIKIIIDGEVKKNFSSLKHKFWHITGGQLKAETAISRRKVILNESMVDGQHYVELWSDRTPVLNRIILSLKYSDTRSEKRAGQIIENYSESIKFVARQFKVDPIIVGAVIYQEQIFNVNFVDALTDYIGGLAGINTSIGIGQIRIKTAKALERYYPDLNPFHNEKGFANSNIVRIERIKDPFTNIRYVAAKIKFSQDRWRQAGFDLRGVPEILGTLYNIEDVNKPILPHIEPRPNKFGQGVKKNYNRVKRLLAL